MSNKKQTHSFCETPNEKCTMNYCDDNGCLNRKRQLIGKDELDEIKFIKKQLKNIEYYRQGYNAAENKLYTEKQVTQAMLEMCKYIISAFERRYLIDPDKKAKEIIILLKKNNL